MRASVSVDFFADLSCPWCYVGWSALKGAAEARRERVAVSVAWRTFLLAPDLPAEGVERKAYFAARYAPDQLAAAHAALAEAAAVAGAPLRLDGAERIPNTLDAHRLVHWAADIDLAEPAIDALFHAYFADGRDIGDRRTLIAVSEEAGLDREVVEEWIATDKDSALVRELHGAAASAGVAGVPVAIFNRKIPLLGALDAEGYARALDAAA